MADLLRRLRHLGSDVPGSGPGRAPAEVFISYAREDRDVVDAVLINHLSEHRIPYWIDDHIEWDASWWMDVRQHLRGSAAVIVAMTEAASTSEWVAREVSVATERSIPIFPVLIEGSGVQDLATQQHLDLKDRRTPPPEWLDALDARVRRLRLRRRVIGTVRTTLLVVLPTVAGLVAVWQVVQPSLFPRPPPLPRPTGEYNVGVAEFPVTGTTTREDVAAAAGAFQERLVAGISDALEANGQLAVAEPDDLQQLRLAVQALPRRQPVGDEPEAERWSLRLLAESGADLLITGHIESDGAVLIAEPTVHLDGGRLPRAEELGGRYKLPVIERDIADAVGAQRLRADIARLGRGLATLIHVVRLYDGGHFREALDGVQDLTDAGWLGDRSGLLLILEGNLHGKLGEHTRAETAYRSARQDPSVQHRAELGLLQALFTQSLGPRADCDASTDVSAVRRVAEGYTELIHVDTELPGANIGLKAHFGRGRALVCAAMASDAPVAPAALDSLRRVVDARKASTDGVLDGDLRELAAESHLLLGLVLHRMAKSTAEHEQAVDHLSEAIGQTTFTDRRAAMLMARAGAMAALQRYEAACSDLETIRRMMLDEAALQDVEADTLRQRSDEWDCTSIGTVTQARAEMKG